MQKKIEMELSSAQTARDQGLEGRARVCARRAAGIAVREYLQRLNMPAEGSAYELLQMLQLLPAAPETARRAADLLTIRINHEHQLPVEADLLEEARKIIDILEPQDGSSFESH